MHESKGTSLPITGPRRFIIDLVHFARQVPSTPVARTVNVSALIGPRSEHAAKPSWAVLFMKAYALVGANHPPLRRSLLQFPWPRLYEHPWMNCALAIERSYLGEPGVFVGVFRAPEQQSIAQLQEALTWYKQQPLEQVGLYRQTLRVSRAPRPVRRLLWWSTLNVSGQKRAKRFGTFGLTSYGALGAESLHPISPLTTTLTFGPISATGDVVIKLIYDHRVLDGAYIARRLRDIEAVLGTEILADLRDERQGLRADTSLGSFLRPHGALTHEEMHESTEL
jgi:pyruvate/2-oxoglutarate dehydrogenase complex dihydrolipoamide acyltransferase (E2) component